MRTLRAGQKGEDIEKWQYFLRGLELYFGPVDGDFGAGTKAATEEFQRRHALKDDGIAGNLTIGAAMHLGFSVLDDDPTLPDSLDWPARPAFASLGAAGREAKFGHYPFDPAPTPGNPEGIRITSGWVAENIVTVTIPELRGIVGAPASGKVQFHKLVAPHVVDLFAAWRVANLMSLVLTYGGSFVPRFIRGTPGVLSAHAHGSALDINVAWNRFGGVPAQVGVKGSVRKLVPIANELGFYWGGHFSKRDGMHFELAH
jgi:hypothetical protein